MKKLSFFLIPILVITSLYFVVRFVIDAIIEMDDEGSFGE
jgi:uncharacterized membrane protein YhdT